jgi:ankyrin repeat protein
MPTSAPKIASSATTSALRDAVMDGNAPAARAALANGADPSYCYQGQRSLLMFAASNPDLVMVGVLLSAGANPAFTSAHGDNALTCALSNHNNKSFKNDVYEIVKLLLKSSSPSQRVILLNRESRPILHFAINHDYDVKMCKLLLRNGSPVDAANLRGDTALHLLATNYDNQALLSLLIKNGASLNIRGKDFMFTPLLCSITMGSDQATRQLLTAGADPNLADVNGRTALHWCAVSRRPPSIIDLALAHGANIALTDNAGLTAEEFSLANGHLVSHQTLRRHRELRELKSAVIRAPRALRRRI